MSKPRLAAVDCLLASAAAQSSPPAQARAKPAHPITLTLAAITPTVPPGAHIRLQVTVKNVSSKDFRLQRMYVPPGQDKSYGWDVRDSAGRQVQPVLQPRAKYLEAVGHTLRPKEVETNRFTNISILLSKPGPTGFASGGTSRKAQAAAKSTPTG